MIASDSHETSKKHGDVLTAISDGMVALLREFYGRGPTRTKSYYHDDLVVCLLRGGFSQVEQTLLEGGRGSAVIQQRMEFQDLMRDRFEAVIKAATGRDVIGFMSGNQQAPDIMCEVFILAPTDLHRRQRGGRPARASGLTLPGPGSVARARARRPRASLDCVVLMNAAGVRATGVYRQRAEGMKVRSAPPDNGARAT